MQSTSSTDLSKDPTPIILKVMRLSRPSFLPPNQEESYTASSHLSFPLFESEELMQKDKEDDTHSRMFQRLVNVPEILQLPSSFGNIYLGETFSCYVCLINSIVQEPVYQVQAKIELQTSSHRFTLSDNYSKPLANLDKLEILVQHEIKELGIHILVCTVQYLTMNQETKFLRKFYKFQVLNPISVKTKVNNSAIDRNLYLEVQVINMMNIPICLERVKLDPNEVFDCTDMNFREEKTSLFNFCLFNPNDSRQYLFKLSPKNVKDVNASNLGKLDILWRSSMGEIGRLQTNSLTRKTSPISMIHVSLVQVFNKISIEEPFKAQIRVFNHSEKPIELLTLSPIKNKQSTLIIKGISPLILQETIPVFGYKDFTLEIIPLATGLLPLGNLRFFINNQHMVEIEQITDIFVH